MDTFQQHEVAQQTTKVSLGAEAKEVFLEGKKKSEENINKAQLKAILWDKLAPELIVK